MGARVNPERTYLCHRCGGRFKADTTTGPLPSVCDGCLSPQMLKQRRDRRLRASQKIDLRAREGAVRAKELEFMGDMLEAESRRPRVREPTPPEAAELIRRFGSPRSALQECVKRLARAQGPKDTAQALRVLADVAQTWAWSLG